METIKIFEDLTEMGFKVAYVENISNTIVLAEHYDDISAIEDYLKKNELNYAIINPAQEEVTNE